MLPAEQDRCWTSKAAVEAKRCVKVCVCAVEEEEERYSTWQQTKGARVYDTASRCLVFPTSITTGPMSSSVLLAVVWQ